MPFCELNNVNHLIMSSFDIKLFREKNGLSQKDLAEYLSVSIRAIQSWEQGYRNIPQSAIKLMSYYGDNHNVIAASPVEQYGCSQCIEKDKEIQKLKDEVIRLQSELLNEIRKTNMEGAPAAGVA